MGTQSTKGVHYLPSVPGGLFCSGSVVGSSHSNCSISTWASCRMAWSEVWPHLRQNHSCKSGFQRMCRCFIGGEGGRSTASQNCISCLNVGQVHQRFALRRWIVSPPYELQLRTVASRRLPNLLSVGIRPAHQSKDGDDTKEPCRFRLIHPVFAIPPPPGGHAHRCESDRGAPPRNKSV